MSMRRRLFLSTIVGLAVAVSAPATAQQKVSLTPEIKQRLMALQPLRGAGADRALFDGRPLLVTFFASW